jgi:hypothetical protein
LTLRQTSGKTVLLTGSGNTVDISSGGLLIQCSEPLVRGVSVELSVSWPIQTETGSPLCLEILGRVVRTERNIAGVRMVRYGLRQAAQGRSADLLSMSQFT